MKPLSLPEVQPCSNRQVKRNRWGIQLGRWPSVGAVSTPGDLWGWLRLAPHICQPRQCGPPVPEWIGGLPGQALSAQRTRERRLSVAEWKRNRNSHLCRQKLQNGGLALQRAPGLVALHGMLISGANPSANRAAYLSHIASPRRSSFCRDQNYLLASLKNSIRRPALSSIRRERGCDRNHPRT